MSQICSVSGNADMYGLGIRLGYYLQWYSVIIAPYISPKEVHTLRLTDAFFVSATFLALLAQIQKKGLDTVETYIVLLFIFGSNLYALPVLLWRVIMRCNPRWDPSRFPRVPVPPKLFLRLHGVLVIAAFSFQIWFWGTRVPQLGKRECVQYGFIFNKVRLDSIGFRVMNLVVCALLLALVTLFWILSMLPSPEWWAAKMGGKLKEEREYTPGRLTLNNIVDTFSKLFIATSVVIATELTIRWNKITDVSSVDTAGQIIPLLISILSAIRAVYKAFKSDEVTRGGVDLESEIQQPGVAKPPGQPAGAEGPTYLSATPSSFYSYYHKGSGGHSGYRPSIQNRPAKVVPQKITLIPQKGPLQISGQDHISASSHRHEFVRTRSRVIKRRHSEPLFVVPVETVLGDGHYRSGEANWRWQNLY